MKKRIILLLSKIWGFIGILLVVIIATLIIFWARGYEINFTTGNVVDTGILRINSTPTNAKIYLNNTYEGLSPLIINSLIPGTYNVKVQTPNYSVWNGLVSIQPQQITNLNSFLLPTNIKQSIVNIPGTIYYSTFSKDSNMLFIVSKRKNGNYDLYYMNLNNNTLNYPLNPTFITDLSNYTNTAISSIKVTSNSDFSYLTIYMNGIYYLYSVSNSTMTPMSTLLSSLTIQNMKWANGNTLILENNSLLATLNINTGQIIVIAINSGKNIIPYALYNGGIVYAITQTITKTLDSSLIYTSNLDGTNKILLTNLTGDAKALIVDNNNKFLGITTSLGNYILNIKSNKLYQINNNVKIIKFSPNSNYLLLDSGNTLQEYYLANKHYIILNNNLKYLYNIMWYPIGGYIFYEEENKNINQSHSVSHESTLLNNLNSYSLFFETESSTVTDTIVNNINGTYYISTNGNYLVVETQSTSKHNLIYIIDLIQNNSILPFSL